jgi:uncharacterized protein (DUF1499 family)
MKPVSFGLFTLALAFLAGCAGTPPVLGVHDGRLTPCPETPNCVSSQAQATDTDHCIDPLPVPGSPEEAMKKLKDVIAARDDAKVVSEEKGYLRAEFHTMMGFVDDVEFLYAADLKGFHVRSASRLGKGDFGVNRKRVESLRSALALVKP